MRKGVNWVVSTWEHHVSHGKELTLKKWVRLGCRFGARGTDTVKHENEHGNGHRHGCILSIYVQIIQTR